MVFEITVGIGLAVLLSAVGTGISLSVTAFDSPGFLIAKICWVAAALVVVYFAVWLTARSIHVSIWQIVVATIISGSAAGALVATLQWTNYRQVMLSKTLYPANEPNPQIPTPLKIPDGALRIYLGQSNLAWATRMPHNVLMMRGDLMIAIDRQGNSGNLVVTTLRIFDDRDNIIARIDEDGFWVQESNRSKRPDPNTLVVFDHHDAEVLRIRFINPHAIVITGVFRHQGVPQPVVVTPTEMNISGHTFTHAVLSGTGSADIFID